jgi:hypothetical protein
VVVLEAGVVLPLAVAEEVGAELVLERANELLSL